jgi:hypothetical protein
MLLTQLYVVVADKAPAYFLSKILVELPMTFIQCMVQFVMVYYMIELQGDFMLLFLCTFGFAMAANSVSLFMGCLIAKVKDVTEIAPLMVVPQFLFAGIFVSSNSIPIFLRWAQWLCSLKYAMNLALLLEFAPSLDSCKTSAAAAENCREVLSVNSADAELYWVYILVMAGLFVMFRVAGGVALVRSAKKFY